MPFVDSQVTIQKQVHHLAREGNLDALKAGSAFFCSRIVSDENSLPGSDVYKVPLDET